MCFPLGKTSCTKLWRAVDEPWLMLLGFIFVFEGDIYGPLSRAYLPIRGGGNSPCDLPKTKISRGMFMVRRKPPKQRRWNAFFTSSRRPLAYSWVPFHRRSAPSSASAPCLSCCFLPRLCTLPLHLRADARCFSSFPGRPSWPSRHPLHPRHWPRPNRMKMTNPSLRPTTPQPRVLYGRCSILNTSENWSVTSSHHEVCLQRIPRWRGGGEPEKNLSYSLFLPRPSLSITSVAQRMCLLSAGTPRSRKVTVVKADLGCGRGLTVST